MKPIITLIAGLVLSSEIQAQAPIKAIEYWFDTSSDPIYSIITNSSTIDLDNAMLNTDGLAIGPHTVHLRLKEDLPGPGGIRYSSVVSRPFQKYHGAPWQITAVRYWMSTEAQPSDMHYLWFDTPQDTVNFNIWLEMCDFAPQSGYLKLQLRDNHGQWSVVEERPVTITAPGELVLDEITASSAVFCPGETYTFTATAFNGSGYATPTSYTWTVPQGNGWGAVPSTGPTIDVTIGTIAGSISVVANNACGSSASLAFLVSLPGVPVISLSDGQPAEVCPNATALTYAVTPDNSTWSYAWSGPPGWTLPGNDATVSASTGANPLGGDITVTASNACGEPGNSVSIPVSITPVPDAAGPISGPDTLCEGTSGTYQVALVSNAVTYAWNGGTVDDDNVDIIAGATDFTVSVQGVNACGVPGQASPPFAVEVLALTAVTILGAAEVCSGAEENYVADPPIADAIYDWNWPAGFTNVVVNDDSLSAMVPSEAGTGELHVTVTTPLCGTITANLFVSVIDVRIDTITGPADLADEGTYVALPQLEAGTSYAWSLPSFAVGSSTTDTIFLIAQSPGSGELCVMVDGGGVCPNDAACITITGSVAIPDGQTSASWTVYPVPSNGSVTIEVDDPSAGSPALLVENAVGEMVMRARLDSGRTSLDLSHLANGTYTLRRSNHPEDIRKVIVQH